ncbi:hypothetical protein C8R44DRAFT_824457 [Mycena epipterygia]|nr:hypothetical protein C8R44DRAFT_824457 [Mycena epipterygia]
MAVWQNSTTGSYSHYFALPRPVPPKDRCQGSTLSEQNNAEAGNITTHVHLQDFSALSHTISERAKLDISFVEKVVSSTGPVLTGLWAQATWQWTSWPHHIQRKAATEQDYYPWLEWVLFGPAAHAVSAVRDRLYQEARIEVPQTLGGFSTTRSVSEANFRGTTDILHMLKQGEDEDEDESPCTAHEVKRSRVLGVGGDVLRHLVSLAGPGRGWAFRDAEPAGLEEKARRLLCQCIDELIYYEVTHIILATQEQYVLLLLDDSHQFRISRVYTILGSSITQARDMAELVLFYSHALLTRHPPYPPSRPPSVSVYRVTVPAFSPRLFQAHEALLCNGHLMHRVKLAILPRMPGKPILRPFSVQFHTSHASCRHEGDIVVSFGRLIFWLFDTHIVAKAAYQSSALDRLQHEFAVYEFLRTLQGVVIPSLFGMYRNLSDGSSMLVTSYAGVTLKDFDTLCLKDRQTLLLRVVRLHQAGVLHNDLEPRNVVLSERSGPRIIDFDNATLNHTCTGLSCKELCGLAHCLGLDLGVELSRAELSRPTLSWLLIPSLSVVFFVLCMAIYSVR